MSVVSFVPRGHVRCLACEQTFASEHAMRLHRDTARTCLPTAALRARQWRQTPLGAWSPPAPLQRKRAR